MDSTFDTEAKILSDNEIVDLYWSRDEQAIEETHIKYGRYLYSIAYNIVNDNLDSEECLNDTYLGAWNSMPPQRPNVLKAFLTVIIRRISINRYHQKSAMKKIPSELTVSLDELDGIITDEADAYKAIDMEKLAGLINNFVKSLSSRRRFIFISRYYFAEPIDKIAKEIGKSKSTVNKELFSIRSELQTLLEREGFTV